MPPARIPEPREWLLKKRCTGCGEIKPWAEYSPGSRWEDGSVKKVKARCKVCEREPARARVKDWYGRNKEYRDAYCCAWVKAKRRQARLEAQSHGGIKVKLEPFKLWLLEYVQNGGDLTALSQLSGVPDRSFRRILWDGNSEYVMLNTVDKVLTSQGEHINQLYEDAS